MIDVWSDAGVFKTVFAGTVRTGEFLSGSGFVETGVSVFTSRPMGSAWVGRSREAGQLDGDVDSPARRNHRVEGA